MDEDNAGYLAAGYLIASDQQRRSNDEAAQGNSTNRQLAQQNEELNDQLGRQAQEGQAVEADYWALFNLIKQPMHVIAQRNKFFAQTYDASQQELADIRVRELAFIELAYQLGERLGISNADVWKTGVSMRADVLQNRFPEEHGTNARNSPVLRERGAKMLQAWKTKSKAFVEEYNSLLKTGTLHRVADDVPVDWNHAFKVFLNLAKQGNRDAQFNTGYCLTYEKGTQRNAQDAESWYLMALRAGDARSALHLHWLYAWEGGDKYSSENAEGYLKLAEQQGDGRAASARQKWETKKQQTQWSREEATLLERLLVITPSNPPIELLEKIKGRDYCWEADITLMHACEYNLTKGDTTNHGSLFSPKRCTDCYVKVTNPTDIRRGVRASFHWDEAELGKRLIYMKKGTLDSVHSQTTSKLFVGTYPKGAAFETLMLTLYIGDKLKPLIASGELHMELKLIKPFVA